MFSRLFKTPKSSLQLFRKNQAAMLPNDAESPQVRSETFSSLPIIRKVGLRTRSLTLETLLSHSHGNSSRRLSKYVLMASEFSSLTRRGVNPARSRPRERPPHPANKSKNANRGLVIFTSDFRGLRSATKKSVCTASHTRSTSGGSFAKSGGRLLARIGSCRSGEARYARSFFWIAFEVAKSFNRTITFSANPDAGS